jgi:hypothetical protein
MADDPLIGWAREEAQRLSRVASTIQSSESAATTGRARRFFADHPSGTTFESHAQRVSRTNSLMTRSARLRHSSRSGPTTRRAQLRT